MSGGDLAAEIRLVPGVEDAEVSDEAAAQDGVRVRLTADADPNAVAEAVRAILADRGLRSRMAPPRVRTEPTTAPPPPVPVGGFSGPIRPEAASSDLPEEVSSEAREQDLIEADSVEPYPLVIEPADDQVEPAESAAGEAAAGDPEPSQLEPSVGPAADTSDEGAPDDQAEGEPAQPDEGVAVVGDDIPTVDHLPAEPDTGAKSKESPATDAGSAAEAAGGLASLRMEEDRSGVTITAVANDGTTAIRKSRPNEEAIQNGVIAAVSALFDPHAPAPAVVAVDELEVADGEVLLVVLDDHEGSRLVGAAVMGAERSFAVARATYAALADR